MAGVESGNGNQEQKEERVESMSITNLLFMTVAFWLVGAGVFVSLAGIALMWEIIANGGMP